MSLRHLVIGLGNMGKKHGGILADIGDNVEYADMEFDASSYASNLNRFDSILVCTPPETHFKLLMELSSYGIPMFCEKPIFDNQFREKFFWPEKTIVACNWRFCRCLGDPMFINCRYPTKREYAELDMIHFIDFFWSRYGKPDKIDVFDISGKAFEISIGNTLRKITVVIAYDATEPIMSVNSRKIHALGICDMFERQMYHWRQCLLGYDTSINDFQVAIERMNWYLESLRTFRYRMAQSKTDQSSSYHRKIRVNA